MICRQNVRGLANLVQGNNVLHAGTSSGRTRVDNLRTSTHSFPAESFTDCTNVLAQFSGNVIQASIRVQIVELVRNIDNLTKLVNGVGNGFHLEVVR